MIIPTYRIQPNPKYSPVYPYAGTEYYLELTDGEFNGLHFNFRNIEIAEDKINFDYNLLFIPEHIELNDTLKEIVGEILQNFLERGYYELDTER